MSIPGFKVKIMYDERVIEEFPCTMSYGTNTDNPDSVLNAARGWVEMVAKEPFNRYIVTNHYTKQGWERYKGMTRVFTIS